MICTVVYLIPTFRDDRKNKIVHQKKEGIHRGDHFTDLKSLLKAEFYASGNLLVKRDILKVYQSLNGHQTN